MSTTVTTIGNNNDLTLRSAPQERISKGGQQTRGSFPSFETRAAQDEVGIVQLKGGQG
ncbi:MAG: hypothetical protein U1E60_29060 [Reyranellaceae bacterium]